MAPLTNGDMYAVWAQSGALVGKKYTNASSTWDASPTTIISSATSSFSAVSDASGNIHLQYIVSGANYYKEYTSSWGTAVTLDSNASNTSPTISKTLLMAISTLSGLDLIQFTIKKAFLLMPQVIGISVQQLFMLLVPTPMLMPPIKTMEVKFFLNGSMAQPILIVFTSIIVSRPPQAPLPAIGLITQAATGMIPLTGRQLPAVLAERVCRWLETQQFLTMPAALEMVH